VGADRIYLVGPSMAALAEALGEVAAHAASIDELADTILSGLAYGDAVMVKGSKGMQLANLVQRIRERFQ
jgi:UDP-N-acetylmuramoyl-tripeptide--D-alanyl-D-alanine ligase